MFNRVDRYEDKHRTFGPDELHIFTDGARGLGKSILKTLKKDYDKMVWYVLDNCEEARTFIK